MATDETAQKNQQRSFRDALGGFATGVTIATTLDSSGAPVGVTASSFNSVSLDPPLVLWSLARSSLSHDAFSSSGHFAVHVLAATQEALSNRFARSGQDKFAGVAWQPGILGSPLLVEYASRFQCRTRHLYEGGDHVILVGEVVAFDSRNVSPLLFHGGRYAERRHRHAGSETPSVDIDQGRFSDDFLFYLISRAHFQTSLPTRHVLARMGMAMETYLTLAILSMDAPLDQEAICARLDHTGHAPDQQALQAMVAAGLLSADAGRFSLTETGRNHFIETLAISKAHEADLADHFTVTELAELKLLLRRIIDLTGHDVPIDWRG